MGGGPQSKILTSDAGGGSHFYGTKRLVPSFTTCLIRAVEERNAHLNHTLRHKAHAPCPAFRWIVQDIVDADTLIFFDQNIKLSFQQDVLLIDVGEDEVNLRGVARRPSPPNCIDNLQHGRDTCASGNHAEPPYHIRCVHERTLRPSDADGVAEGEGGDVLRDGALWVGFYEEVEEAWLMIA